MADLKKILKMQEIIQKKKYSFSDEQLNEISSGLQSDIDIFIYLNPEYSSKKMKYVRMALENKIDYKKIIEAQDTDIENIYNELKIEQDNKHKHTYIKTIIENATCVKEGLEEYKCECGNSYTKKIEKLPHDFIVRQIMPTCQKEGYSLCTCKNCGYQIKKDFVEKVPHIFDIKILKQSTCKKQGRGLFTCLSCGMTKEDDLELKDHQYKENIIKPNCIEKGYTLHVCEMCGESYQDTFVDKKPHLFTQYEVVKEATCVEKGIEERICKICKTVDTKMIPLKSHDYIVKVVRSTCSEEGYDYFTCRNCGYNYKDNYMKRLPHKFLEWNIVKDATTINTGIKQRKCKICGLLEEKTIPLKVENKPTKIVKKQEKALLANYTKEEFEDYLKKKKLFFNPKQNLQIKKALLKNLDVKLMANPKFDSDVMSEIMRGLERGVDLSPYARDYNALQLNEIRIAIEDNMDVSLLLDPKLTNVEMMNLRLQNNKKD